MVFMLDEWEVHLYMIVPSLPQTPWGWGQKKHLQFFSWSWLAAKEKSTSLFQSLDHGTWCKADLDWDVLFSVGINLLTMTFLLKRISFARFIYVQKCYVLNIPFLWTYRRFIAEPTLNNSKKNSWFFGKLSLIVVENVAKVDFSFLF